MTNKVTSYELSKELHDLGYKPETDEGGYWGLYFNRGNCEATYYKTHNDFIADTRACHLLISAPDCHDLLMWLKNNSSHDVIDLLYAIKDDVGDKQPQNALAKAIIWVLKSEVKE